MMMSMTIISTIIPVMPMMAMMMVSATISKAITQEESSTKPATSIICRFTCIIRFLDDRLNDWLDYRLGLDVSGSVVNDSRLEWLLVRDSLNWNVMLREWVSWNHCV